jgi:HD-GYP domain-containing protein (c-di-GMP phosphodiesterase class II)
MIVKTHTVEGQRILERVGGFMRQVGMIVRSHHERWDGTGYPDGLAGEEIPIESRIIACCDTWHAMRTTRPYRRAMPHEAAVAELVASAGGQLDPHVVETLLAIVGQTSPVEAPEPDWVTLPPVELGDQVVAGVSAHRLLADGVPLTSLSG